MKLTPAIEGLGYGLSGDIGGLPKTTYYTPDGRAIKAFPDMREYVIKRFGKVVGNGRRDANLDKGWLLIPPITLKIFCPYCDYWHDTQAEIKACGIKQNQFIKQAATKAKRVAKDRTSELETQVAELKAKLNMFLEAQNGQVLQPVLNAPKQVPRKQGVRKAKGAVQ